MIKELENKIGQLQYEISLLGLDQEDLTGVTIRTDELKDLVKNLSLSGVVKEFTAKDTRSYREWVKDECIDLKNGKLIYKEKRYTEEEIWQKWYYNNL